MATRLLSVLLLILSTANADNINQTTVIDRGGTIKTFWNEKVFGAPLIGTRIVELNSTNIQTKDIALKGGVRYIIMERVTLEMWYQREIGVFDSIEKSFEPRGDRYPEDHYLIKLFYNF